jgi:ketosteroid isomerase-like protein
MSLLALGTAGLAALPARRAAAAAACTQAVGMSEARFRAYIDAFNRQDSAAYTDYYADDVVLTIAGRTELRGRQAIIDFYKNVTSETVRTIQVNKVITAANHLAAELQSEFLALQDVPNFTSGPMKKGGRIFINTFAFYNLRDGKFARIRSATLRRVSKPPP